MYYCLALLSSIVTPACTSNPSESQLTPTDLFLSRITSSPRPSLGQPSTIFASASSSEMETFFFDPSSREGDDVKLAQKAGYTFHTRSVGKPYTRGGG